MTQATAISAELAEFTLGYRFRIERVSKHAPARLWRAITDAVDFEKWWDYPVRVDLRVGGEYFSDFARSGGGTLDGIIVAIEPERVFRYTWGTSVVEWRIEPEGSGCRYVFEQNGLAIREIPGEEGLPAGWHAWFEDLDHYLDDESFVPTRDRQRWIELGQAYLALLLEARDGANQAVTR